MEVRIGFLLVVGKRLPLQVEAHVGQKLKMYFNGIACRDCSIRAKYTRPKRYERKIRRWEHEEGMELMQRRLDAAPDTMVIRKQTVEHSFGTIKSWMGSTHFLTKRLKNVSTEMSLHVLAYNLKRMLSILGQDALIRAPKAWRPIQSHIAIQACLYGCVSEANPEIDTAMPEAVVGRIADQKTQ